MGIEKGNGGLRRVDYERRFFKSVRKGKRLEEKGDDASFFAWEWVSARTWWRSGEKHVTPVP